MEYTIEQMENSVTVFYYKTNGDIYNFATGIQDQNIFFGEHSVELASILDQIIVPKDEYFLRNSKQFKVNIDTKALEILPNVIQYPVANI